jgi:hypothetical protein
MMTKHEACLEFDRLCSEARSVGGLLYQVFPYQTRQIIAAMRAA